MRQANWHEEGGNARMLKGTEAETLREHASPCKPPTTQRRGERALRRPTQGQALYPDGISRRPRNP